VDHGQAEACYHRHRSRRKALKTPAVQEGPSRFSLPAPARTVDGAVHTLQQTPGLLGNTGGLRVSCSWNFSRDSFHLGVPSTSPELSAEPASARPDESGAACLNTQSTCGCAGSPGASAAGCDGPARSAEHPPTPGSCALWELTQGPKRLHQGRLVFPRGGDGNIPCSSASGWHSLSEG